MSKVSYNEQLLMEKKNLERQLWEVFWSYSVELGFENNTAKKEEIVELAKALIPDFAESAREYELDFTYPVVFAFLTSLVFKGNFLTNEYIAQFMQIEGPDNNAKLAYLVNKLKQKGIVWQQYQ